MSGYFLEEEKAVEIQLFKHESSRQNVFGQN
jgi:hypothetical protein